LVSVLCLSVGELSRFLMICVVIWELDCVCRGSWVDGQQASLVMMVLAVSMSASSHWVDMYLSG
jgi:hypothetical protein